MKNEILNHLLEAGYTDIECEAGNENNFFSYCVKFQSRYHPWAALRPYIKIECMNLPLFLPASPRKIISMVDKSLNIDSENSTIECQNVEEILIEKVLATLRRLVAYNDPASRNLMRHIYDISQIVESGFEYRDEHSVIFDKKIQTKIALYGRNCVAFAANPKSVLAYSLESLNTDPRYSNDYEKQINPMLFDEGNSDFDTCIRNFNSIADKLIR